MRGHSKLSTFWAASSNDEAEAKHPSPSSTFSSSDDPRTTGTLDSLSLLSGSGASVVYAALRTQGGANGTLTLDQFGAALQSLRGAALQRESAEAWPEKVWSACDALFELLDPSATERVPYVELAAGLAPFCVDPTYAARSPYRFALAMFALYDEEGDGIVSHGLMCRFLSAAFTAMRRAGTFSAAGWSPESLAHATSWQCFSEATLLESGGISRPSFERWLEGVGSSGGGGGGRDLSPFDRAVRAMRLVDGDMEGILRALRRFALSAPGSRGTVGSTLTLAEFSSIMLLREGEWAEGLDSDPDAVSGARVIFDSCDSYRSGTASFIDLGVSLIVGWADDAHLMARFTFALAGVALDGFLDVDALAEVLTAVLRFATHAAHASRRQKADVAGIADAAAARAAAKDGLLSLGAVERWYAAQGRASEQLVRIPTSGAAGGPARMQLVSMCAQLSALLNESRAALEGEGEGEGDAAPPGLTLGGVAGALPQPSSSSRGGFVERAPTATAAGRLCGFAVAPPLLPDVEARSEARSWRLRALGGHPDVSDAVALTTMTATTEGSSSSGGASRSALRLKTSPSRSPQLPRRRGGAASSASPTRCVSRYESDEMFRTLAFASLSSSAQ